MKKSIIALLGATLMISACNSNTPEGSAEEGAEEKVSYNAADYPKSDIVETPLGEQVLYGVTFEDYAEEYEVRGYEVRLELGGQEYIDTAFLELSPAGPTGGEVIFAEAVVNDMGDVKHSLSTFRVD